MIPFNNTQLTEAIKHDVDIEVFKTPSFKKLMSKITHFRHLSKKEQDQFLERLNEFPRIRAYLLEIQLHDEFTL